MTLPHCTGCTEPGEPTHQQETSEHIHDACSEMHEVAAKQAIMLERQSDAIATAEVMAYRQAATIAALREALANTLSAWKRIANPYSDIVAGSIALQADAAIADPNPRAEALLRLAALVEDEVTVAHLIADVWRQGAPYIEEGKDGFDGADRQLAHYLLAAIRKHVKGE